MKPHERLAQTTSPDGTVLTLLRHDGAYYLRANGVELMSTRRSHSETELAEVACAPLTGVAGVRVLVGGLGFGFTLRAALAHLAPDAEVVVAELLPDVIAWNRNPEWALGADAVADARVTVKCADVLAVLRGSPGMFDAIMLDVDNGAEAFTTAGNDALYDDAGIGVTVAALRPGGVLAYWLATEDARFVTALRRNGLQQVEAVRSRIHASGRGRHVIVVGRRTIRG